MQLGEIQSTPTKTQNRLRFIDLARTIAILLMLEGHFVGVVLAQVHRDPNHWIYSTWSGIRRFSAPLFFTVSGLIFCYLLTGEKSKNFFQRKRVKKGFVRVGELFFWGYALQLSLKNFESYLRLDFDSWIFAFHVLQCIGCGILALIGIARLQNRFEKISLKSMYMVSMGVVLAIYEWLERFPEGEVFPLAWPEVFQNMVHGNDSVFPIFPWLAYVFLGGVIGVALRDRAEKENPRSVCIYLSFVAIAALGLWALCAMIGTQGEFSLEGISWFAGRACEVSAFLALLSFWEARYGIGMPRFLRMGTQTFEIYVMHVILLYGGLFGYGIKQIYEKTLNPWQTLLGTLLFWAFFYGVAQVIHALRNRKNSAY